MAEDKDLNMLSASGEENAPEEASASAAATFDSDSDAAAESADSYDDDDSDNDDSELPPLPEVTKIVDEDTEAKEEDMPTSSPRSFGCGSGKMPRGKLYDYDWLRYIPDPHRLDIVKVQFKNTRSGFYRNDQNLMLSPGDMVAVEAAPGHDIGEVIMTGALARHQMRKLGLKMGPELKRVFRIAKPADIEKYEEAIAREHDTMIRSRKIAEDLGLNMKIGDVEYQGDGAKAIFYYIADERVDFRKLIRILADTFKIRIEMKQIGARQEAGRIGGIGPCGRALCCSSWLSNFVSVGTSAARFQDISMNPQKLAGQCGKLKCCLNFEVDNYIEAQKKLPPKDAVLYTADGEYHLFKSDILKGEVTYSTDKSVPANLVTISAARAFEIIEMNKRGEKPEELLPKGDEKPTAESTGFINMIGQDSLTRFDKSKRKKKRKGKQEPEAAKEPSEKTPKKQTEKGDAPRDKGKQKPKERGEKSGNGRQNAASKAQQPEKGNSQKRNKPDEERAKNQSEKPRQENRQGKNRKGARRERQGRKKDEPAKEG